MLSRRPTRQRGTAVGGPLSSIVLSLLASAAATFLLRQALSAASRAGTEGQGGDQPPRPGGNVNVNVPVVVIVAGNRSGFRGRPAPPPPIFLPFLLARVLRAKRHSRSLTPPKPPKPPTPPTPPWQRSRR